MSSGLIRGSTAIHEDRQAFSSIKIRVENFLTNSGLTIPIFYEYIDKNQDNSIDKEEFTKKLRNAPNIKLSKYECEEFFNFVDSSKNGEISYKEFATAFKDLHVRIELSRLYKSRDGDVEALFYEFSEKKGFLSLPDIEGMM